jgi:hypothetical protein
LKCLEHRTATNHHHHISCHIRCIMMRQIVHPSTYQDEDASPNSTTHHITTRNVYIHTLQSSASMQPGVHHKGIFLELELSRGHGYQSRLTTKAFIYSRKWTFGVLNVSRANCTNEWREPTYGTAFSNERKRRNEALGFSVFISVYYSRISLVFSDHAQTNAFAREPEK